MEFTNDELLPDSTAIHRVDDGRVYYYKQEPPHRLYVKHQDKIIDATLPEEPIIGLHVIEWQLYFATEKKIFSAEFSPTDGFRVTFVRDRLEGEQVHEMGVCSMRRRKMCYYYEMDSNPARNAVCVDFDGVDVSKLQLRGTYRDKVVFSQEVTGEWSAQENGSSAYPWYNTILLKVSRGCKLPRSRTNDYSSSFLYLIDGRIMRALNTKNMTFLPPVQFYLDNNDSRHDVKNFVSVHDGEVTIESTGGFLMTAALPDRYFNITLHGEDLDLREFVAKFKQIEKAEEQLIREKQDLVIANRKLEELLIENKVDALQSAKQSLKFQQMEKLTKPLIYIQLANGTTMYFDNAKPFELYFSKKDAHESADLTLLDGEFDCTFRGTIENQAYFSTVRGKIIKFFKATIEDGHLNYEQINEMKTSELSLFNNQPYYFIERSKEWSVYQYHENYSQMEGEKFEISGIDLLSKYERHYHRGVLYLFRETSKAAVTRMNDKVVKVEGPLLEFTSFHTPPHSDSIYILNPDQCVLLILDTTNLHVSQMCYEPPADSNNHSIVGFHGGVITMAFDGVWGRHLSTTAFS